MRTSRGSGDPRGHEAGSGPGAEGCAGAVRSSRPAPPRGLEACCPLAAAATSSSRSTQQLVEAVIPDLPVQAGPPLSAASALRHLSFCTVMLLGSCGTQGSPACVIFKKYVHADHPEGEYLKIG